MNKSNFMFSYTFFISSLFSKPFNQSVNNFIYNKVHYYTTSALARNTVIYHIMPQNSTHHMCYEHTGCDVSYSNMSCLM